MTDVAALSGLFVGQLSDEEAQAFNAAVSAGRARCSYEGAEGFKGLARVRLMEPEIEDDGRLYRLHANDYL